jgi:hypothetical protein
MSLVLRAEKNLAYVDARCRLPNSERRSRRRLAFALQGAPKKTWEPPEFAANSIKSKGFKNPPPQPLIVQRDRIRRQLSP